MFHNSAFHRLILIFRFERGSSYPRFFYPKLSSIVFNVFTSSSFNPYVLNPILPLSFVILVSAIRNRVASSLNSSTFKNPPASMFIYSPLSSSFISSSMAANSSCALKYISFSTSKFPSIEKPKTSLF